MLFDDVTENLFVPIYLSVMAVLALFVCTYPAVPTVDVALPDTINCPAF